MLSPEILHAIARLTWPQFARFAARLGVNTVKFSRHHSPERRVQVLLKEMNAAGIPDEVIGRELEREAIHGDTIETGPTGWESVSFENLSASDKLVFGHLEWAPAGPSVPGRSPQPAAKKPGVAKPVRKAALPATKPAPAPKSVTKAPPAKKVAKKAAKKAALSAPDGRAGEAAASSSLSAAAAAEHVDRAAEFRREQEAQARMDNAPLPPPSAPALDQPRGTVLDPAPPPSAAGVSALPDERFNERLMAGEVTIRELFARLPWLEKVDREAFQDGSFLAAAKDQGKVSSAHLLAGYVTLGPYPRDESLGALSFAVWKSHRERHPGLAATAMGADLRNVVDAQDMYRTQVRQVDRDGGWISAGLGRLLVRSFELVRQPLLSRRPYITTLLLCLLGPREWHLDPEGVRGMAAFDFDFPTVRREFYARIRGIQPPELAKDLPEFDTREMVQMLGLEGDEAADDAFSDPGPGADPETDAIPEPEDNGYRAGAAGFNSEYCRVGGPEQLQDHLRVATLANRLAELMTLRQTKMPLAVGLFGNWGSGKSHFMTLMDQHMRALARQEAVEGQGPWCQQIVHVYFNAWHYIDSNLWASLVTEIFDRLFRHVAPMTDPVEERKKKVEKLMLQLHKAKGAAAEAEEELELTEIAKEQAQEERKLAEVEANDTARRRNERQAAVNGMLDNLGKLMPDGALEQGWEKALLTLCPPEVRKSYRALRTQVAQFRSLTGRLRAVLSALMAKEGRAGRFCWLAGAVIIGPGLAWLYQWVATHGASMLPQISPWLGGVVAVLTWSGAQLKRGLKMVSQIEQFEKKSRVARQTAEETRRVKAARRAVARWEAKEEEANLRAREARTKVKRIQVELNELRPERRLFRFIEQRAQSTDYRNHLGLVSLVRRDFNELSDYFGERGKESLAAEKADKLKHIDRIVLYVDDLDRCQPDKVVDVLQAVHLLLAFPIFAVVVGVDQRCLRQSLRLQFRGLIADADQAPGGAAGMGLEERPATPLDYLEKIFHVPFHLPDMDEEGFAQLMTMLADPKDLADEGAAVPMVPPSVAGGGSAATPPVASAGSLAAAALPGATAAGSAPVSDAAPESLSAPPAAASAGSVQLYPWEAQALSDYHPLIRTPRGLKRLLNTYRLVRAGVGRGDWDAFQGDRKLKGEFRVVMLLLAAAAGHPAQARGWFQTLRTAGPDGLLTPPNGKELEPGLQQFQQVYLRSFALADEAPVPASEPWLTWLDKVERFAF